MNSYDYDRYREDRRNVYARGQNRQRREDDTYRSQGSRSSVDERGFLDRAGDEIRSWFGDENAERRRLRDDLVDWRDKDHDHQQDRRFSRERWRNDYDSRDRRNLES